MLIGTRLPTLWRSLLSPSSGSKQPNPLVWHVAVSWDYHIPWGFDLHVIILFQFYLDCSAFCLSRLQQWHFTGGVWPQITYHINSLTEHCWFQSLPVSIPSLFNLSHELLVHHIISKCHYYMACTNKICSTITYLKGMCTEHKEHNISTIHLTMASALQLVSAQATWHTSSTLEIQFLTTDTILLTHFLQLKFCSDTTVQDICNNGHYQNKLILEL